MNTVIIANGNKLTLEGQPHNLHLKLKNSVHSLMEVISMDL